MSDYTKQLEHHIDKQDDIILSLVEEIKTLEEKLEVSKYVYSVEWVIRDEDYEKVYAYAEDFEAACRMAIKGIKDYREAVNNISNSIKTHKGNFINLDFWWICVTDPNHMNQDVKTNIVDFAIQISPEGNIMAYLNEKYKNIYERIRREEA